MAEPDSALKLQVKEIVALEKNYQEKLSALKEMTEKIEQFWQTVKDTMIDQDIKSIKGDFGSITIAERQTYKVDETKLSDEYFKQAPDLKKIGNITSLTGEPPEGVTVNTTRYLTKRLK